MEHLKELLAYDAMTGNFTRKKSIKGHSIGDKLGHMRDGYHYIQNQGFNYPAHKLAFYFMTGIYPNSDVDHIDRDRSNNRFSNLRIATRSQNMLNTTSHRDSELQCKNVSFIPKTGKFNVKLTVNGRVKHIGNFDDLELADLVAQEARNKYHSSFTCH